MTEMEQLLTELKACRLCEGKLEPRPVWHGSIHAPILQVSQAPGKKVHESGIPFSDQSGRRLRESWYQVSDAEFYDPDLFYLTSVGHCFPGKAKSGDRKPPRCCYDRWVSRELALKPDTELILVIGREAADRIFPGKAFTDLVFQDQQLNGVPCFVLPHPSPLNVRWFKAHPEFERDRIPVIRQAVHAVIDKAKKKQKSVGS